ncbi:hybrid sensor histidine kinase/response regulator [Hymenobacter tenuis]
MTLPRFALSDQYSEIEQARLRIQELEAALQQATYKAELTARRLGQLMNHLQEGIMLTDEAGCIVLINDPFCNLWELPLPATRWIGQPWRNLAAEMIPLAADPVNYEQNIKQVRQLGLPAYKEIIELKSGRVLERDFMPVKGVDSTTTNFLVCMRDTTDYHRATEQLRSVASISGQNPNPMFRLDESGQILYTNTATNVLFQSLEEEDQSRLLVKTQRLAATALEHNQAWQVDISIGAGFHTAFVAPFREEGYANIYLVNVTKRILAEQELNRAKDEAEAAVRARENFLANMSHEIRTPMNGVLGMAAQLTKTPLNTHQQGLVRIIRSSGQHLLNIINDVLDMAKITSGKLELEQAAFNLCDSMSEALQPLVMQAIEKGITVSGTALRESCPLPWVITDPYRINQVLINLVANAIKFTEPGGHITVISRQVASTEQTLTIEFSVSDTGIGIPTEQQDRIFEGFTQAYADTTRRFGGTGLGLSISKAIVEQLGGQLEVESTLGSGSTFRFVLTLPRTAALAPAAAAAPSFDTGKLRGRRVLLVEDNEINRDVARMLLDEWGVLVDEAEDGAKGVELLRQRPYDVVLMDIQMPGMSGLEATAIIRRMPDATRANVPILALTANAFRADSTRYLEAGMDAYLTKPFEEEELYNRITELLQKPAVADAAPSSSYDLTKLQALAHGRHAFVEKIIRSFLTHIPESLSQLEEAAAAHDWVRVNAVIHHIKPGVESLGVRGVADALQQLQQDSAGLEADTHIRQAAVTEIVHCIQQALMELPRELT